MKKIYIIWEFAINKSCEWRPIKASLDEKYIKSEFDSIEKRFKYSPTRSYKLQTTTMPLRYVNKFTRKLFPIGYKKWKYQVEADFKKELKELREENFEKERYDERMREV